MNKKFFLKMLAVSFCICISTHSYAKVYSGSCGENVNWSLDTETGLLRITGSGEMERFDIDDPTYGFPYWFHSGKKCIIGNGVTSIGNNAFSGCYGLTNISIPDNVTSIGNYAFVGCYGLTNISISNSVTSIGNFAFSDCSGLTKITIPENVTSIGRGAFSNCSGLTKITWNAISCSIDLYSKIFTGSSTDNITSFIFGDKVQIIPHDICYQMSSLTNITIPNSVTSIGYNAFYGCSGLTNITIPESVTSIGDGAFEDCSGLTNITWNAVSCSYSSPGTFQGSTGNISSFTFGDKVQIIPENICYQMSSLTNITIPNSVTKIGANAFCGCDSLTNVSISNGVTKIASSAFKDCSGLTNITIPNSVTEIGYGAFEGCSGLNTITMESNVPPTIYEYYFTAEQFENIVVRVPQGYLCNYQNAEGWKSFHKFEEYNLTDIRPVISGNKDNNSETIYNLHGIRMKSTDRLPAGLYIINGRKVLVK